MLMLRQTSYDGGEQEEDRVVIVYDSQHNECANERKENRGL
jgi:hypothetical protein